VPVDDRIDDQAADAGPVPRSRTAQGVSAAVARRNLLLDSLSDADVTLLISEAHEVPLELGTVLYEPGRPVETVHFPLSGVISLVTDLGESVVHEAATVGFEGMSGISVHLGAGAPTERAVVQVAGRALALDVATFERAAAVVDGPLFSVMRRYTQLMFTLLARNAACNRNHTVQQRAARWLLTTSDRMRSPTFVLTQSFLAQMLAVRRSSIGRGCSPARATATACSATPPSTRSASTPDPAAEAAPSGAGGSARTYPSARSRSAWASRSVSASATLGDEGAAPSVCR
jgi:CRP-like cAMP-binding protein